MPRNQQRANVGLQPGTVLGWSMLGQVHRHRAGVLDMHVLFMLTASSGALGCAPSSPLPSPQERSDAPGCGQLVR